MILVAGATGFLGQEITRLLCESDLPVKAMVRCTSDVKKVEQLKVWRANIVEADLKNQASLAAACVGATTVISTASATLSRQDGDSILNIDKDGQLALVDAAESAGVRHFIYISFAPISVDCMLQKAKREVETRLRSGKMIFTILQPVDFMDIWLSPMLGFDPMHGHVRILGSGQKPVSWIAMSDVARFAVAAVDHVEFHNKIVPLGGPDALSPLQVLDIFRELGSPKFDIEYLSESRLGEQLTSANDHVQEAFAALMLSTARGYTANHREAVELLPGRLISVRDFATNIVNQLH